MTDFDDTAVHTIHPDAPDWANVLDQRVRAHLVHMETRAAAERRELRDKVVTVEAVQRQHGEKIDRVNQRLASHLELSEPLMAKVTDEETGVMVRLQKVEAVTEKNREVIDRAHWYALGGLAVLGLLVGLWKVSGGVILKLLAALAASSVTTK